MSYPSVIALSVNPDARAPVRQDVPAARHSKTGHDRAANGLGDMERSRASTEEESGSGA